MSRSHSHLARRVLVVAGVVAGVGATGALAAALAAGRRWGAADDPTGGEPLRLAEGIDTVCVTDDGARLAVRVLGSGDAGDVVLPHCWMGSRRFWGPVAERLVAAGHRVVVYDQRGHGESTVGGAGYTIDALGDDLDAVLQHVDVRDVVVAGHSLGGMTAQSFLIRHPSTAQRLVRGVVLVSTACEFRESGPRFHQTKGLFGPRMTAVYGNPVMGPMTMRSAVGRRPSLAHLRALTGTIAETPHEVRVDFLLAMADMDLAAGLAQVDTPVRILVGARDQVTTPAQARTLAASIPAAQLEVLPDHGHMLVWEAPDRIVEAIQELGPDRSERTGAATPERSDAGAPPVR